MRALDALSTAKANSAIALICTVIRDPGIHAVGRDLIDKLMAKAKEKLGNCYRENHSRLQKTAVDSSHFP
jgi:hypothetical protein